MEGVHCRCVMPCCAISSPTGTSCATGRGRRARSISCLRWFRWASTWSASTPKSIRQAISSTPRLLQPVAPGRGSAAACRTGRWCRSSARTRVRAARPCPLRTAPAMSMISSGVLPSCAPRCTNVGNDQAACRIRSTELRRYSFIGPRTVSRTSSSSSPTKVCSISVTWPSPGWPASRQASRYSLIFSATSSTFWPSRCVSRWQPSSPACWKVSGLPAAVSQTGSSGWIGRGSVRMSTGLPCGPGKATRLAAPEAPDHVDVLEHLRLAIGEGLRAR